LQPGAAWVLDAERGEPACAWHACDSRRPPHTRPDKRPTWGEIHHLARADAPHRVHAGMDEEGEMRVRTPPPIRPEHITGCSHRVHLLHLGAIVRQEGRDDQLEEHPGARMEQPQEVGHGNAAPQSRRCRLAKRVLEGRRIRHRASRAIAENGAMARPSACTRDGRLHRAAEALEKEGEEASREFGARLAVCRRAEPQARQMGPMAAGGVAVQHLQQE
jgi:hypothetical protein